MAAWSTLRRNTPLRRGRPRRKPTAYQGWKYNPRKRHGFPPDIKMDIYARDEGLCQVCGEWGDMTTHNAHHIRLKSQGGPDTAENGLWVCEFRWDKTPCHARIHNNPEWAYKNGYMVRGVSRLSKSVNVFPREG